MTSGLAFRACENQRGRRHRGEIERGGATAEECHQHAVQGEPLVLFFWLACPFWKHGADACVLKPWRGSIPGQRWCWRSSSARRWTRCWGTTKSTGSSRASRVQSRYQVSARRCFAMRRPRWPRCPASPSVSLLEIMRSNGFCLANTETIVFDQSPPEEKDRPSSTDSVEHMWVWGKSQCMFNVWKPGQNLELPQEVCLFLFLPWVCVWGRRKTFLSILPTEQQKETLPHSKNLQDLISWCVKTLG